MKKEKKNQKKKKHSKREDHWRWLSFFSMIWVKFSFSLNIFFLFVVDFLKFVSFWLSEFVSSVLRKFW